MIFEKIREMLQELCEQTYYNSVNGNRDEGIRNNAYHNAIDIINQVEAEYNNGWIKCEGKTFAVGCKYLIVDKDNDIYIATYLNDNVFATRDKDYFMPIKLEATYCQLLPLPPQPPKGE